MTTRILVISSSVIAALLITLKHDCFRRQSSFHPHSYARLVVRLLSLMTLLLSSTLLALAPLIPPTFYSSSSSSHTSSLRHATHHHASTPASANRSATLAAPSEPSVPPVIDDDTVTEPSSLSPLPDLSDDVLFEKASDVFQFGTHGTKARTLKALLNHYQTHLKKLPQPPPSRQNNPSTQTTQDIESPSENPINAENEVTPLNDNDNPSQVPTPQAAPPASSAPAELDLSPDTTSTSPPSQQSLLYRAYYKALINPFFQTPQEAEITLVLLDWVNSVPLVEHFSLIETILMAEENPNQVSPEAVFLKAKALETLQTLSVLPEQKTPIFLAYIKDPKTHLSNDMLITHAVEGLAGLGGKPVVTELRNLFAAITNNDLKIALLRSISAFELDEDIDFFAKILTSREVDPVIWTALVALEHYPASEQAETLLLSYAHHKDPKLAARAIYALSPFSSAAVYETLLKATQDNHPLIRLESLKALNNQQRHSDDISELIPLIQYKETYDDDPAVRQAAKRILLQRNLPSSPSQ